MTMNYGNWQQGMGCKMNSGRVKDILQMVSIYMESGKHALQESMVGKKIYTFFIVSVPPKYDNWKGIMTSGDKNWHVN